MNLNIGLIQVAISLRGRERELGGLYITAQWESLAGRKFEIVCNAPNQKPSKLVVIINNPLADLFIHYTYFCQTLDKSKFTPNILSAKLSYYTVTLHMCISLLLKLNINLPPFYAAKHWLLGYLWPIVLQDVYSIAYSNKRHNIYIQISMARWLN